MDADFYIGLGANAVWLGGVEGAGDPAAVATFDLFNDHQGGSRDSYDESDFRAVVAEIIQSHQALADRDVDGWTDTDGWPWKHDDSSDTDYTYAWNNGCIHVFDQGYLIAQHYPNGARKRSEFPRMTTKEED